MNERHLRPVVALAVLALAGPMMSAGGGCSTDGAGPPAITLDEDATAPDAETTAGDDDPLAFPAYVDPAEPIFAAVGQRFGLALEVDPATGARWRVTAPPDPFVLASLGTELRQDADADREGATTQVLSFAAASEGATSVEVTLVGADGQPVAGVEPLTFQVTVTVTGEPPPPPEPGLGEEPDTVIDGTDITTTTTG
jgi:hypothetical protein